MDERTIKVAPSILSADFRHLEREVKAVEEAGADMIHCDVMDGDFVPNITFGPLVVEAVRKCVNIPVDVHLMISHPERYVQSFRDAGADIVTAHAEAVDNVDEILEKIRQSGARVGVTVNPDKPVSLFLDRLDTIDQVLIMTVYAGFGGQKFIAETMEKVRAVYDRAREIGHPVDIQVDGGIDGTTSVTAAASGANILVAGSYIFGAENYHERIAAVRSGALEGAKRL
jgi:ribulose-phosphate 3-epimerase